jgi:hypothetical protein
MRPGGRFDQRQHEPAGGSICPSPMRPPEHKGLLKSICGVLEDIMRNATKDSLWCRQLLVP